MSEPRTYVVGLPVVVTVHDDGTVDYWIDKSEVTSEMHEEHASDYDREQIEADEKLIDKSLGF